MRKEAKVEKAATISTVQGYHAGSYNGNYAYQGYKANRYFTSDRYIPLDDNFNRPDGKPLRGYGLEIETECRGITNVTVYAEMLEKVIFPHFPEGLFKLQRDGSLSGDVSAECITQVMTREFIRNNYANFKLMYNTYFPAFGVSCSRTGHSGMHVNISNALFGRSADAQALAIKKLLYIVNRHFKLFCALTNRNAANTYYCGQMPAYATMEGAKNANLNNMPSAHANCINASHYPEGRIELRIVGGQKDFGCFRNTMEAVFHVVEAVKRLSWNDCNDVTKIFAGCNQYVYDRLNTKCYEAGTITREQLEAIKATTITEELL
jgi:hypothetical protein